MKKIKEGNNNELIFGTTNSHYFIKHWIQREVLSKKCTVVFDFDSEYTKICEHLGGKHIEISKENNVNPFMFEGTERLSFYNHVLKTKDWLQVALKREFKDEEKKFLLDQLESLYQPTYLDEYNDGEIQVKNPYPTLQTFLSLLEKEGEKGKGLAKELQPFIPHFSLEKTNISLSQTLHVFSFSHIEPEFLSIYLQGIVAFLGGERQKLLHKSICLSIGYDHMEKFAENEIVFTYATNLIRRHFVFGTTHMVHMSTFEGFTENQLERLIESFHNAVFDPTTKEEVKKIADVWCIEEEWFREFREVIEKKQSWVCFFYCNGAILKLFPYLELEKDFFE